MERTSVVGSILPLIRKSWAPSLTALSVISLLDIDEQMTIGIDGVAFQDGMERIQSFGVGKDEIKQYEIYVADAQQSLTFRKVVGGRKDEGFVFYLGKHIADEPPVPGTVFNQENMHLSFGHE